MAELLPRTPSVPQPKVRNALAVSPDLSIAPALEISAQLVPFHDAVLELEGQGSRAVIDSQETFQRGTELLSICKQHVDQLETFRVTVKRPIDDYAKFIQALFKPLIDRLTVTQKGVGQKMLAFQKAERERLEELARAKRRQQEEEAVRLAQEREAQGDTKAAEAIMEAATMAPQPLAAPRMATTSSLGHRTATTATWRGEVADPMTLLRAILELKVPIDVINWSQAELNAVARKVKVEGVHHGIKVSKEESLGMRR